MFSSFSDLETDCIHNTIFASNLRSTADVFATLNNLFDEEVA